MKLKTLDIDGKTYAEIQDEKPVYVAVDGKNVAFDYDATLSTIARLNGEAKNHRERADTLAEQLKVFEGIDDPVKAKEALGLARDVEFGKLIHAGKIDEVKAAAKAAFDEQITAEREKWKPVVSERDQYKEALNREIIGGAFSRSKYIADKMAIPVDMVQSRFGSLFTIDGNKVVGQDSSGNKIFSRARPGEIADFDEALETFVDQYPYKDNILKGSGASGSGAGGSRMVNGRKTVTRATFEQLDAAARIAVLKDSVIVD